MTTQRLNHTNPSSCICRHFLPHSAREHFAIKITPKYGSCEPKLQTFEVFVGYDVYLWSLASVNHHMLTKLTSGLMRCYNKWRLILKPVSYFPHKWTPYYDEHFTARVAHSLAHANVYFHMLTLTLVYKVPQIGIWVCDTKTNFTLRIDIKPTTRLFYHSLQIYKKT